MQPKRHSNKIQNPLSTNLTKNNHLQNKTILMIITKCKLTNLKRLNLLFNRNKLKIRNQTNHNFSKKQTIINQIK